jgi:DNA-binding IscR family transcriptional regulator
MRANCRFAMAVHVLAVLAYRQGGGASSTLLASSVNTNPVIIRRLLLALQAANLVETRKGPGLGSRLSRAPDRINLAEVFRAVECEESFAMPRRAPNDACPVGQCIREALEDVFGSARAALEKDLAKTTLACVLRRVQSTRGCSDGDP